MRIDETLGSLTNSLRELVSGEQSATPLAKINHAFTNIKSQSEDLPDPSRLHRVLGGRGLSVNEVV